MNFIVTDSTLWTRIQSDLFKNLVLFPLLWPVLYVYTGAAAFLVTSVLAISRYNVGVTRPDNYHIVFSTNSMYDPV